jgi:hypothetical protein
MIIKEMFYIPVVSLEGDNLVIYYYLSASETGLVRGVTFGGSVIRKGG